MHHSLRGSVACCLTLAFGACGDSGTFDPGTADVSGSWTFTYSGQFRQASDGVIVNCSTTWTMPLTLDLLEPGRIGAQIPEGVGLTCVGVPSDPADVWSNAGRFIDVEHAGNQVTLRVMNGEPVSQRDLFAQATLDAVDHFGGGVDLAFGGGQLEAER